MAHSAIRYCNWLHNGKPKGAIHTDTTEEGAYTVTGPFEVGPRNPDAKFVLPNDNEWYKAAYYEPASGDSPGSFKLFDRNKKNDLSVVRREHSAVSSSGVAGLHDRIWEWNEDRVNGLFRSLRSGAWFVGNNRQAAGRLYSNPELVLANVGIRVVQTDAAQQKPLRNVLILGDSISIGYTQRVRRMLAGQIRVVRPHTNCGPTTRGLENIEQWLGDTKWDVIHFNFGLHDLKYINDDGKLVPPAEGHIQVPIDAYEKNLAKLTRRLKTDRCGFNLVHDDTGPRGSSRPDRGCFGGVQYRGPTCIQVCCRRNRAGQ